MPREHSQPVPQKTPPDHAGLMSKSLARKMAKAKVIADRLRIQRITDKAMQLMKRQS